MSSIIDLILDGDGAFKDLQDKVDQVIHLTGPFTIAAREGGMTSGQPSLIIRIDLPDGKVVLQETSVQVFLAVADTIKAKFHNQIY